MNGRPDATRLAHRVHLVLLIGVAAAGLFMSAGLAIAGARGEPRPVGRADQIRTLPTRLAAGDGVALIEAGLIVLIVTPGLRVAVLGAGWAWARDWYGAAVAAAVLMLLAASVWVGLG
jgi:uncharacterized membrane protein